MFESLKQHDIDLLLSLNGSDSIFWDRVMTIVSTTVAWIPALLVLLIAIIRNNKMKHISVIFVFLALSVLLADQFASTLCKPYFMRFRPTHDPMIMYMVDTVDNYRGGLYGFISSHAANTFAVAIYITMLFKDFRVSFSMFVWAMITSFSRIYLGVHYPGDVVFGALAGIIIGLICYSIVHYIILKMGRVSFVSSQYNRNGYRNSDMQMVVAAVNMTYVGIIIASLI